MSSLNRQEILDEDEYTAALSHIIARDFFPSLDDATHITAPDAAHPVAKRPRYDTDMNLDSFQARYTSEDNASFTHIMHDENRQRRDRWAWAWDAQTAVEQQRQKMLQGRERMLIEQPAGPGVRERFVIEAPAVAGLITTAGEPQALNNTAPRGEIKTMAALVRDDASEQAQDVLAPKRDTRPAGVDAWKFKTRNSLMFPPDADVSPYDPSASNLSSKAESIPRVIKHDNTRLPEQDVAANSQSLSVPPSPTQSRIGAAIEGTPYRPKSPSFSLVSNVPSPTADQMGSNAVKQLMTWGTLNATPRVISQSDDASQAIPPPNSFQISAPSSREALSHKLSARAAKSLRAKAGLLSGSTPLLGRTPSRTPARGSMAPPSWTPRRADAPGNLTPAAKRLLDRTTLGTAAARRPDVMNKTPGWGGNENARDKGLNHVRWTPTPVTREGDT